MDNREKIYELGYEDTDKDIEVKIYGLNFKISKNIEKVDTNNVENIEEVINNVLGEGATKKINEQRIKDGKEEIDTQVALGIISFCMNIYVNEAIKPIENMVNNVKEKENTINNFGNREQRRNYNRNRNNYRGNRYRRY